MNNNGTFYGWRLLAVFWCVYCINVGFVFYGANVINTLMVQDLAMSRKTLGAGFALFHLIQSGLSAPFIAYLINRRGIRCTLALGSILAAIGAVLMTTIVTTPILFLAVFGILIGFGIGFGGVLGVQTGVTIWFVRKRALAMSLALTAAGIGGFIAAPALNLIMTEAGGNWKTGWLCLAALCTAAFLLSLCFVKNRPSDLGQVPYGADEATEYSEEGSPHTSVGVYHTTRQWTARDALRTGTLWLVFAGILGFLVPYLFCVSHGVIHLIDQGFPPITAALSLGLITLFSIIGRLAGGLLGDRIEPRYLWAGALLLECAGIFLCMHAEQALSLYLYSVFVGIGFGCAFILMPTIIGNYFGPNAFASIMGVISPLFTLFSSASPFAGGLIYDGTGSYDIAFIGSCLFCVAGFAAILAAGPRHERSHVC
ncbi:MAG: MFS transporter [Deltaproteobacteria bacterium]|nr:MFS transporter [Deltaproteobacteria bacterium]